MNANELRALADALEPMSKAPRFEDFDVPAFCAWVRACADAKPVAWVDVTDSYGGPYVFHGKELLPAGRHDLYTHPAPAAPHHAMLDSHRRLVEQAIQDTEHPSGMSTHDGKARIDASILRRMLAIIDSSPAAPHPSAEDASRDAYEGCREDLLDWKRRALKAEREARNLAKALADTVNRPTFMGEPAAPQAEPTRDPNPDEVICPACTHQFRAIPENVQAQLWAKREPLSDTMVIACARVAIARIQPDEWVATDADLIDFARAVERAHGIGGSDGN